MNIADLDYHLPSTAIATAPAQPRDASRLMVVHSSAAAIPSRGIGVPPMSSPIAHRHFRDLPEYLHPGDLLILNQTRVIPAKLALHKSSGAAISGLFLRELPSPPAPPGTWEVMLRTRGKVKTGDTLLAPPYQIALTTKLGEGLWHVTVTPPDPAPIALEKIGHVPLPPYITRQRKAEGHAEESPADRAWYQTVYAHSPADHQAQSVAAPTAGLHFTPELLARLATMGVQTAPVELAVGMGTFLPVETETLEAHPMHREHYHIPAATINALRQARAENRRIIPVGTTAVRTLESAADQILGKSPHSELRTQNSELNPTAISGETALLISPGFHFQLTDALITNFHLPRSTLMALVAAFLSNDGLARLKALYAEAIEKGYRFYSYGDAMLIH